MSLQRVVIVLLGGLGRWLFQVKYVGAEHIPADGPVIIASNHVNAMDPFLHAFGFKREFKVMAKKELFKFKPLGWLIGKVGGFPVDRGKGDRGAIRAAQQSLQDGGMLLIFPEGTRSKTGKLLPFKSGAAMFALTTQTPVVPALIRAPKGVGLFRPTTIEYGAPISPAVLSPEPEEETSSAEIKAATGRLRVHMEEMQKRGLPNV